MPWTWPLKIAEETSEDGAREKLKTPEVSVPYLKGGQEPLFDSRQNWRESMNIDEVHSQGREGTGNQMAGFPARLPKSILMLIAQVRQSSESQTLQSWDICQPGLCV